MTTTSTAYPDGNRHTPFASMSDSDRLLVAASRLRRAARHRGDKAARGELRRLAGELTRISRARTGRPA